MSYDFGVEIDTGGSERHHIEPYFDDTHPDLGVDGFAGTAQVTATGYARCGNYTSNVSGMWRRCLTAVMAQHPEAAQEAAGRDDRSMVGRTVLRSGKDGWEKYTYTEDDVRDDEVSLRDLAYMECGRIAPLLKAAVEWGVEHIDELVEDNPENGWGNAEGAITYLWDIQRMCEQHPRGQLYLST